MLMSLTDTTCASNMFVNAIASRSHYMRETQLFQFFLNKYDSKITMDKRI